MDALLLVLLHLGGLHPLEKILVGVVAFGPFVVLGIVVHVLRKRDLAQEAAGRASEESPDAPG
jgi:hypothetical protein